VNNLKYFLALAAREKLKIFFALEFCRADMFVGKRGLIF
jgi:hypothetical protein